MDSQRDEQTPDSHMSPARTSGLTHSPVPSRIDYLDQSDDDCAAEGASSEFFLTERGQDLDFFEPPDDLSRDLGGYPEPPVSSGRGTLVSFR
jgi:hypothetical protein